MSIEWVERQLNGMGAPDLAIRAAELRQDVHQRLNIADVPLPEGTQVMEIFSATEDPASPLGQAISTYKDAWRSDNLTPRLISETWNAFWGQMLENSGVDYDLHVPRCDRTSEELAYLKNDNRGIVLLPDEIMAEGGIKLLGELLPEVAQPLSKRSINNHSDGGGCVDVEMSSKPPNVNTSAKLMRIKFATEKREGQRIQTYLVASYFNNLLTGRHFDQDSKSVLLGSYTPVERRYVRPVLVTRQGARGLDIYYMYSIQRPFPLIGFRSEGRKKS